MASISLGVESSDIRSLFDRYSIVVRLLFDFYRISIEEETINNRQTIEENMTHHRGKYLASPWERLANTLPIIK